MKPPAYGFFLWITSRLGKLLPLLMVGMFLWLAGHATVMGMFLPLEEERFQVINSITFAEEEEKSQQEADYSPYLAPWVNHNDQQHPICLLRDYYHYLEVLSPPPDITS